MTEQSVEMNQGDLLLALDRISDGIMVVDANGRIMYVNTRMIEVSDLAGQSLLGTRLWEHFADTEAPRIEAEFRGAMAAGADLAYEVKARDDETWVHHQIFPSPQGMTIVVRDVTAWRETEQRLRDLAAQRADLLERLVQAQEAERSSIAADVHDDSVQVLTAVQLRLQLLERKVAADAPHLLEHVGQLHVLVTEATGRLRNLLFDLEPPAENEAIHQTIHNAAAHIFDQSDITWSIAGGRDVNLAHPERVQALRIVKEALGNALRHASARHVEIRLEPVCGGLEISISDDGVGMVCENATSPPGHRGLTTMRDRAEICGGWCRVEAGEPSGTRVRFFLPGPAGE